MAPQKKDATAWGSRARPPRQSWGGQRREPARGPAMRQCTVATFGTLAGYTTMHGLLAVLVPVIITVAVGLIILVIAQRFSPDPLITKIVQIVVFVVILVVCLIKLVPLLGIA